MKTFAQIAISALMLSLSLEARASIRQIFTPMPGQGPMAIILMQGIAPVPGQEIDPQVREFYDSIATPPQTVPNAGKGKVTGVKDKAFALSCAEQPQNRESVSCTFTIKSTARTKVSPQDQTADVSITGTDAETLFHFFAGAGLVDSYEWRSKNGWIHIEATAEEFRFHFTTRP